MTPIALITTLIFCLLTAMQFASVGVALWRLCRPDNVTKNAVPFIALVRPLCGLNSFEEATLRSSFLLNYPCYEILFCVASRDDPVIPLVEKMIACYPEQPARLLIGEDRISGNPKLNNLNKAWHDSASEWVAMADSNLLLPADYLQQLVAAYQADTGLVSSPASGILPLNLWGSLEAAMLNTYQARWQFLSDWAGAGFAQGKTLFWRRDILVNGGGLAALGTELAEDVAATKLVRRAGLRVRLSRQPFRQPVGRRTLNEVWSRQLRWARIRRFGFLSLFIPEILMGLVPALTAAIWLAASGTFSWGVPPLLVFSWYAAEWGMAKVMGWPHRPRDVLAMLLRDIMLPALWVWCWTGRGFSWRGHIREAVPSAVNHSFTASEEGTGQHVRSANP